MSMERPSESAGGSSTIGVESPKSFDHSYTNSEGIKESFCYFSAGINELDKQLGRFANDCLKLGRVAGLLLAIKKTREMLRKTREVFFRNAAALSPELFDLAHKDCTSKSRDPNLEHFFMHPQFFRDPLPPFNALPKVLEDLAQSLRTMHVRIDEFREFTDEGLFLKSLLLTLEHDLLYRASCARVYSGRLNTPPIQRYIHQFTNELESDFEKVSTTIGEFTEVGVSAISHEQQRSSQNLSNILTVATFFSGVTAGTLAMSTGTQPQTATLLAASMLWFTSLVFSVGAALNSLLAMAWKETRSGSRGGKLPFWVTMWIDGSQLVFLGISIVMFSTGLIFYVYSSDQAPYTPIVTVAATGVTFIGLIAILIWMVYEMWVSPVLTQQADIIKSSAESIQSDISKLSFLQNGIAGALSNAFSSFGFHAHRDTPQEDAESTEEKRTITEEEEPPTKRGFGEIVRTKLQGNVKDVSRLNSTVTAFLSAKSRHQHKHPTTLLSSRNRLHIDINAPSVPVTQLNIGLEPRRTIEFSRYGTIHDIAYSEDGKWLAVACARERTHQSWTAVLDSESLAVVKDTWHEGTVIVERLVWSPAGTKLIIKFDHRFDVWDLATMTLTNFERHHHVKEVKWCGDDTFLVAEHNCVFKMNLTRLMAVYRFDPMHVRSIGFERKTDYLILVTRVAKSEEQFEPASGRSEKRIVIYDMDKRETVYEVPVLENICGVHPIAGELDLLVTHKDDGHFQLWNLDAGLKGTEIMARLKKRTVTPHTNPGDYIGPTCIGGSYNQFVLSATSTGVIDIWRRETGSPLQRFEAQILRDDGVHCLSWRRTSDGIATFATAGVDGHTIYVWQGEEPVLTKSPSGFDSILARTQSLKGHT